MLLDTDFLTNATGPKLPLWDAGQTPLFDEACGQPEPALYPYLLKGRTDTGAVIVCPGGAYSHKAAHEAEPVAMRFNELGFHAFVLDYRVTPYQYPAPLLDVNRAVRYVRANADKLGVGKDKIYVLGFSAGGHLAAMSITKYDGGDKASSDPVERESSRPDAGLLCYGVNTMMYHSHLGSMKNLLGDNPPLAQRRALSCELNITFDTPPVFLWHTSQDTGVPVQNSIDVAQALSAHGITFALHVYPFGGHGIGLGNRQKDYNKQAVHWSEEAGRFLQELEAKKN